MKLKVPYQLIILIIIFLFALIIRLYPVIKTPIEFMYGFGQFGDSFLYHTIAYNLYKGNGFSGTDDGRAFGLKHSDSGRLEYTPAITRGPIYPLFMCAIYKFFGKPEDMDSPENWHNNWVKVRIAQCILDATICLLVFFIVRLIYSSSYWPALVSAFLYSFSFYNIYYTKALLSESVAAFLLTSSVFFCILGFKYDKAYWWILTGIGFGLTILSRPEFLLFPFLLLFYIVFIFRSSVLSGIKKSIIFIISMLIMIAPWTLRNYIVFKEPIIVSTGGLGYNLYLGTFESDRNWKGWGVFPDEIFGSTQEKQKTTALYLSWDRYTTAGDIKIKELDGAFLKLALGRIKKNPIGCIKLWIMRLPSLWYQNYSLVYEDREASGGFFIFYFIFALYAFFKTAKNEKLLMAPICLLFVYLTLLFLPAHIEPRYGVGLMPSIICLTGIGVWQAYIRTFG